MRRALICSCLSLVLLVCLPPVGPNPANAQDPPPPTQHEVTVKYKCPKEVGPAGTEVGMFSISVKPLTVEVAQGDSVIWKLKDRPGGDEIRVSAKNPDDWLYQTITSKGQNEVVLTQMNPGAKRDEPYLYEIKVYCGTEDGPIILDPRIKVQ
jgi:hypothetical protein